MTATEQAISELHAWFCERTGLRTKLCFSQRLWFEMLRSYCNSAADNNEPLGLDFAIEKLRADADRIIRYLKKEIARDKRNLGALKLVNFLQPDNFDADLAIAKMTTKKKRDESRSQETTKLDCTEVEARADDQTRGKIAEQLRTFRQNL